MAKHKYMEIKNYIMEQIKDGVYLSGNKIESEKTLMRKFDVSRMTVRQAITELQNENILTTVKGKGTFLQTDKLQSSGTFLMSFSENARIDSKEVDSKIIAFDQVMSDKYQNEVFQFKKPHPLWEIRRIRYLDKEPAAYEESYIPVEYIPELSFQDIKGSLFSYLDEHGININSAQQKYMAETASDEIAAYLEVDKSEPLLKRVQISYDYKLQCIELNYCYYHPDNFEMVRTVIRKKHSSFIEHDEISILFACGNHTIASEIERETKKIIAKEKMQVKTSTVDIMDIDKVINGNNIVLLDPRYRYYREELTKKYPNKCILVMDMNDFAHMDARKILMESIQVYEDMI